VKVAAIVIVVVGLCATVMLLSIKPSPSSNSAAMAREKPFLSVTISYFDKFKDQASTVVLAMVDASDLEALKRTFLNAKSDEMTLYAEYSKRRSALTTTVQEVADGADDCHRLFQQGLNEMLAYWDDRDTARIPRGSDMVKTSMAEASSVVAKINVRR
jgi:hypothetical protein